MTNLRPHDRLSACRILLPFCLSSSRSFSRLWLRSCGFVAASLSSDSPLISFCENNYMETADFPVVTCCSWCFDLFVWSRVYVLSLVLLRAHSIPFMTIACRLHEWGCVEWGEIGSLLETFAYRFLCAAFADIKNLGTYTFRSHILKNQGNRAQSADSSKITTILGLLIFTERSFNFHFSVLEIRFATAIVVKSNICQRHKQIEIHLNCGWVSLYFVPVQTL